MKKFKLILFAFYLILLSSEISRATPVTVASIDVPNWRAGGATCSLRLYASDAFTDSTGVRYIGGSVGSVNFFQKVDGTVTDTTCTLPSFIIQSTTDAMVNPAVRLTAALYDSKDVNRGVYLSSFAVPASLGGSVTWAQITTFNQAITRPAAPEYYNKDQVNAVIQQQIQNVGLADAAVSTKGAVKLSAAPTSPTNPIAVGVNDPLVLAQAQTAYASSFANLSSAVTSIGSSTKTKLVIANTQTVAASLTIPANVTLDFEAGGMISVNSGQTLTIGSMRDAGNRQIFTGAGNVIFGQNAVGKFNLAWWVGRDDSVDATKGISNMMSSLQSNAGGEAAIPVGFWKTSGNLMIPSYATISGAGMKWSGFKLTSNNASVFKIDGVPGVNVGEILIKGLKIDASSVTGGKGVSISGVYPNSLHFITFEDVDFKGGDVGLEFNAVDQTLEIQRLSVNRCLFEYPTSGFKINSINSDVHFDSNQFLIPPAGIALNIVGVGNLTVKNHNVFGSNPLPNVPQTDGSTFLYIDGVANTMNIEGGQDENIQYLFRTSTNFYPQGVINLKNNLVQSIIKFSGARTIHSYGNIYSEKAYRNDTGAAGVVFSEGDYVFTRDESFNTFYSPNLADWTGSTSYIAKQEDLTTVATKQNQYLEISPATQIANATQVYDPAFSLTASYFNWKPITSITGRNIGQPLLQIGDQQDLQFYGYRLTRDAKTNLGWLAFQGNQAEPYKGYSFDAAMKVAGRTTISSFAEVNVPNSLSLATQSLPNPFALNSYYPIFRSVGKQTGQPLLQLGDEASGSFYGYNVSRSATTNIGWLTFEGNQGEPFKGYSFDAAMKIRGADVVTVSDAQTLTNKTISQSQVTNLSTDLAAKASLSSPALTGVPTAPTASAGTNTTQLATTAFAQLAGVSDFQFSNTSFTEGQLKKNKTYQILSSGVTIADSNIPAGARITVIAYGSSPYLQINFSSASFLNGGAATDNGGSTAGKYTVSSGTGVIELIKLNPGVYAIVNKTGSWVFTAI